MHFIRAYIITEEQNVVIIKPLKINVEQLQSKSQTVHKNTDL